MQDEIGVPPCIVLSLSDAAHHLQSRQRVCDTAGKCDGLLAVSEELLKKQFHNATEKWTCHAVDEGDEERRGKKRWHGVLSLFLRRIDGLSSSSASAMPVCSRNSADVVQQVIVGSSCMEWN
jgi:hypothetical protein